MADDVPPTGLPVSAGAHAEASFGYSISKEEHLWDIKVFPPCFNKIEDTGRIRKRKFLISCNGKGTMHFSEIISKDEKIRRLQKLRQSGVITDEDFDNQKKRILEEF
jgi:hypothetical protein